MRAERTARTLLAVGLVGGGALVAALLVGGSTNMQSTRAGAGIPTPDAGQPEYGQSPPRPPQSPDGLVHGVAEGKVEGDGENERNARETGSDVSDEQGDDEGSVPRGHALDRDGVDGAIREVIKDIRGCYQDALAEIPDLEGGFRVVFQVEEMDGSGGIAEIEIRDLEGNTRELQDDPMEQCVLDVIEVLTFEVPPDGEPVVVDYPFRFSPG